MFSLHKFQKNIYLCNVFLQKIKRKMKKSILGGIKPIFLLLVLLMNAAALSAQSAMTDEQVLNYVMEESAKGTSHRDIFLNLRQRGVSVEQMQRIKNNYEQGKANATAATGSSQSSSGSRMRTSTSPKRSDSADASDETEGEMLSVINELAQPPRPASQKQKLRIFGHDVFNNKNLTFESSMNLATPQNYVLGPGDAIIIDIWGGAQRSISETISPDGTITVSDYGPIALNGLSIDKAKKKIQHELGTRYQNSDIDVSLGQTRSITISVMGEVRIPGTYTVSAFSTVYNALYMAGGPNDIGTLRNVKLYRNGRLVTQVDVYDFLLNGKLSGDVRLQDNDIITVSPYEALVSITGKVKRPMYYEIKKGETVATLIQYAGGFSADAYTKAIRVNRKTEPQLSVFSIGEFDMSQFKLMDGDSISIDATLNRYQNMVEVRGAVFRPGMYQISGNINTVKTLVEAAAGLKEGAIAHHAVLRRMNADRTRRVISVNLNAILNGTATDIPLSNEDILFIASNESRNNRKTVTIYGEVISPGTYPYAEDESIEDLIIQAGGPTEAASLVKIDVARRILDPTATTSNDSISMTYSFKLNPDLTIEDGTQFTLMPYDEIYVRRSPNYNKQQNVIIEGEVEFAGTYTLTSKTQHLSEVIKRAGGLTKHAYLQGARLMRNMTHDERLVAENVLRTAQRNSGVDSIDISKLVLQPNYPIGFELDKALENPGTSDDPILREGDRIVIPRFTSTVSVNGEVLYPNTIRYKEDKNAKYYINQSGGYTSSAKKRKAIIIYMNGMVAKASSNKPMPGCQIVVPTKKKSHRLNLQEMLSIGSTTASLGVMAATIANLTK